MINPPLKQLIVDNTPPFNDQRLDKDLPPDVQSEIDAVKAMLEDQFTEEQMATSDPHYERIIETLTQISDRLEEEAKNPERFLFNQAEFVDALEHVVADQLSALKKEKISPPEWCARFNRWFVFCDTVANMGISCLYSKEALQNEEYETVFKTLKLNKQFEAAFLKPRGIRVEFKHKSKEVMEKYPWLAMPVLLVKDEAGEEHQIAITPSPYSRVWWLDVLISFHGSYDWVLTDPCEQGEEEDLEQAGVLTPTVSDPYPYLAKADVSTTDVNNTLNSEVNKYYPESAQPDQAEAPYTVQRNDDLRELLDKAIASTKSESVEKPNWFSAAWTKVKNWFR